MPIQNQPLPSPEVNPEETQNQITPEVTPASAPEQVPEQPISKEVPQAEQFQDQQTSIPRQPVQPQSQPQPQQDEPVSSPQTPNLEEQEAGETVSGSDKQWVAAVDTTIEKDKDKPFEEEEDSEKLQVDYLSKRFGKKIDKEEQNPK